MKVDLLALFSEIPALKLVKTGSGTIVAPATSSSASNLLTIPHGLGTTNLVWSVAANASAVYGSTRFVNAPWTVSDGRVSIDAYVDANNLYIKATSSTAGSPTPNYTFPFTYSLILV